MRSEVDKRGAGLISVAVGVALLVTGLSGFSVRSGVFVGDPVHFGGYPWWARIVMAAGAALLVLGMGLRGRKL